VQAYIIIPVKVYNFFKPQYWQPYIFSDFYKL